MHAVSDKIELACTLSSLGVQEVAVLTATHDPAPRRRSYDAAS